MRSYFFWLGVFAAFALVIYDIKYSVNNERNITAKMEAELLTERKRLHILEVEWSMLTRPERISALAQKHLPLQQIGKTQFLTNEQAMWRVSHEYQPENQLNNNKVNQLVNYE
jgi:hypothetical protein